MLPPLWGRQRKALDERYWLELEDNAKLSDALAKIKVPKLIARAMLACINGALSKTDAALEDGDSVSFFPIVHGG